MYPPVKLIYKLTTSSIELDNKKIPKDSMINVNVPSIHRNENLWKDPNEFNPNRFLEEYENSAFIP